MKLSFQNKESEYLVSLINASVNEAEAPAKINGVEMDALFDLAKKQQVYNIILPMLSENGLLDDAQKKIWNDYRMSELQRTITINNEREAICRDLDKQGIKYMFLKGLIIRDYYPKSFMRQMSDNDIMFDVTRRADLAKIMSSHGFKLVKFNGNTDEFFKKPFCNFEFHKDLFDSAEEFVPDFSFVWDNAVKADGENSRYIMSCEDTYLHCVAHMYKHGVMGGFGIRFLTDLYLILKNNPNMDMAYVNKKLDEMHILDFNKKVTDTAFALFGGNRDVEVDNEFLSHMLSFGVYGDSRVGVQQKYDKFKSEHKGHLVFIKYCIWRLFPTYDEMILAYPNLKKAKILLPYYYIKRLLQKAFVKKPNVSNEINIIKNMKDKKEK